MAAILWIKIQNRIPDKFFNLQNIDSHTMAPIQHPSLFSKAMNDEFLCLKALLQRGPLSLTLQPLYIRVVLIVLM